jgi:hypothetical protein
MPQVPTCWMQSLVFETYTFVECLWSISSAVVIVLSHFSSFIFAFFKKRALLPLPSAHECPPDCLCLNVFSLFLAVESQSLGYFPDYLGAPS